MTQIAHLNQLVSQQFSLGSKPSTVKLWVPSTQLTCLQLPPLSAPKKKWPDIIPWQLEDSLLDSPDQYQIVWHQEGSKEPLDVFAIPNTELNHWQLLAQANNVNAVMIVPDFLALSVNLTGWSAHLEGEHVIVRTEQAKGFCCDVDFFWQLLERELQTDESFTIALTSSVGVRLPSNIKGNSRIDVEQHQIDWQTIEPPRQYDLQANSTNIPQQPNAGFAPWRATTVLATVLLFAVSLWLWLAGSYYDASATQLSQVVQRDYQQLFGNQLATAQSAIDAGTRQQQINQVQTQLFQRGAFAKLRDLDLSVSSCTECELMSLNLTDKELELVMTGSDNLRNRFVNLDSRYDLRWQTTDAGSHVLLIMEKSAGKFQGVTQ